jgi:hypothetical protein
MKIELHVTYEVALRSTATLTIESDDGEMLGQITLPYNERSEATIREGRDAYAGVFLASLTAALSNAIKLETGKEKAR